MMNRLARLQWLIACSSFFTLAACSSATHPFQDPSDLSANPTDGGPPVSPDLASGVDSATADSATADFATADFATADFAIADFAIPVGPDLAGPLPCGGRTCMGNTLCCNAQCVDTGSDPANCNGCGQACVVANGTAGCMNGMCYVVGCAMGFAHCNGDNGCATNINVDPKSCGACGHLCKAPSGGAAACVKGKCQGSCMNGRSLCGGGIDGGGACVDVASDPNNCNGCDNVCNSGLCGAAVTASMKAAPPDWKFNGSATFDANAMSGVLTAAGVNDQAGTIIYKNAIVTDTFDVQFDFRLGGGTRADGIAFMLQTTGATAVGSKGGGFGVVGLSGYAVEFDLYDNGNCSDAGGNGNHAGIDTLIACDMQTQTPVPLIESADLFQLVGDIGDGTWRTALIHLAGGQFSLTINGKAILTVAIGGFKAGTSYWFGFGGGTGLLADRQEIRNVTVAFPTPRCL